jgi:hypothetical protein
MPDLTIGTTGWNDDLVLTATGDLATVDGTALGVQRVTRRLLTAPRALLFHPAYGFGIPQRVGTTTNARTLTGLVRAQIYQEVVVAQNPPPSVQLAGIPPGSGEIVVSVKWTDRTSGAPQLLQFTPG